MPTTPPPRPVNVLKVRGLRVEKEVPILEGIDWDITRGQHWVVLGPNGCGKTTLLQSICGYVTPTEGEIRLLGRRFGVADWVQLRRRVGIVSSALSQRIEGEETALEVVVSGRYGTVNHWGEVKPIDRLRAELRLAEVGLAELASRPWRVLSQGERQRVLIARALVNKPRLLFLDEPCAGLDPVARGGFLAFLQGLLTQERGPTVVLVTHHVEEIVPGITHGLILSEGRLVAAGALHGVVTSRLCTEAYGLPVQVRRKGEAYRLELA